MLSGLSEHVVCSDDGKFTIKFDLGEPSTHAKLVALNELRETDAIKRVAIVELRKLLEDETDLYCPKDNDDWLVLFLRPCKFYPQSARDLVKRYYSFKLKHAKLYRGLVPSNVVNIFREDLITVLTNRDQHGRRILIQEFGKRWNYKMVKVDEIFKGMVLLTEALLLEPDTQINGLVAIYDMDGLSLTQSLQVSPAAAKRLVDCVQDSVPLRIKGLHVVNQPKTFNALFKLFKPFLQKKLASRIHFHGTDLASLHSHISPKCLPAMYGGTAPDTRMPGAQWHQLLLKYEPEFEAINSYGYIQN